MSAAIARCRIWRSSSACCGRRQAGIANDGGRRPPRATTRRYALSSAKIEAETGWKPQVDFDDGLAVTVAWYRNNRAWIDRVRSGEYRSYYEKNYGNR